MKKTKPLNEVPAYRRFIQERDRAIEALFNRAMNEQNDLLRGALSQVVGMMLSQFPSIVGSSNVTPALRSMDAMTSDIFTDLAHKLANIQSRMMAQAFLLAAVGEAEAMGRAQAKPMKADFKAEYPSQNSRGEPLWGRARASLQKIHRNLMDSFEAAVWIEDDLEGLKRRLAMALPKRYPALRPPKVLKSIKEAGYEGDPSRLGLQPFEFGDKGAVHMTQGFFSDDEWADLVDSITSEYIVAYRGPEEVLGLKTIEGKPVRYAWEYEQDQAHELVRQVTQGTNEAARRNGITSFVWIAVIDEKTDECCEWRDGLLVEEIADALQNEHSDDECQAFAPPAHFNCRCRLAPVIDEEGIEPPPSNLPEFDEWLTTI